MEIIVQELKTLPPDRLDSAADYDQELTTPNPSERISIIERTAGSATAGEGDGLGRIIEEVCEQLDEPEQ